jgi:hypothetical protein
VEGVAIVKRKAKGELIWNSGTQEGNTEGVKKRITPSVFAVLSVHFMAVDLSGNLPLFS